MKTAKAGDWWDVSWNPITGCTPCSPGCEHCWASGLVARFPQLHCAGLPFGVVKFHPERLRKPLGLAPGKERPRRIFSVDLGDWCHSDVERDWQVQMLAVMTLAPWHTFVVCTKRAERQAELLTGERTCVDVVDAAREIFDRLPGRYRLRLALWYREHPRDQARWPLRNLWVLGTVCNQDEANRNVWALLATPAAVRGVHVEPMLGPVDLNHGLWTREQTGSGEYGAHRLDWVIVGGENGGGARPMEAAWVRGLRDQCRAAGVPFWFKGWGTAKRRVLDMTLQGAGTWLDGRQWNELPAGDGGE